MTLKIAKRLQERQVGKISLKSLEKVFLARRVNPRLVETIFLNSSNEKVLDNVHDFLVERVVAGDKRALNVLLRASDESLNKNLESRLRAVDGLEYLALRRELGVWIGLLRAASDSDTGVRRSAISGFVSLASHGELKVLPSLLRAVGDSDALVRWNAVDGLKQFALKGEAGALPGLLKALKDSDVGVSTRAVLGFKYLAKLGNRQAQEKLIQLKETW